MESILRELNLTSLLEKFSTERVDPDIVIAATDAELMRLGVATIGDRVRLRERCRRAVREASGEGSQSGLASQVRQERSRLFGPYRPTTSSGSRATRKRTKTNGRPWTGNFVCLADASASRVPDIEERQRLHRAGLGSKKIKLSLGDTEEEVVGKVESHENVDGETKGFPALKTCGGFEFMSCQANCRELSVIGGAWTAKSLKAAIGGGQAKIYIRPIQKSIAMTEMTSEQEETTTAECTICGTTLPVRQIRAHRYTCDAVLFSDSDEEVSSRPPLPQLQQQQPSPPQLEQQQPSPPQLQQQQPSPPQLQQQQPSPPQLLRQQQPPLHVIDVDDDTGSRQLHSALQMAKDECQRGNNENAVDVLRIFKKHLVRGRPLQVQNENEPPRGATNHIMVDRANIMSTGIEEIKNLEDKFFTLEVQFYGEVAFDVGGPRKEFFRLILREFKTNYFDQGLKEERCADYEWIAIVMGLSILQDGKLPRFLSPALIHKVLGKENLEERSLQHMRKGFQEIGIYQMHEFFPVVEEFFLATANFLTMRALVELLKPQFSPAGSNRRHFEGAVYSRFIQYLREAAGGRRGNVTLGKVLQFVSGSDEIPVLGYDVAPRLEFIEAEGFLPRANTCINLLTMPMGSIANPLPNDQALFNFYDYAFCNDYFGLV